MDIETNKNLSEKKWVIPVSICAVIIITLGIFVLCYFVFHNPDVWPQLLAICMSACLGAAVTAIITRLLLNSQSKVQRELQKEQATAAEELERKNQESREKLERENREYLANKAKEDQTFRINQENEQRRFRINQENEQRNFEREQSEKTQRFQDEQSEKNQKFQQELQEKIQLRNNKIKAYSDFTAELYKILNKNTPIDESESDLERLRIEIFSKLIFYVDPSTLNQLSYLSEEIHKDRSQLFSNLSSITSILRDEILNNKDADDTAPLMVNIWKNLSFSTDEGPNADNVMPLSIASHTFWHFNMWSDVQIEALKKGKFELSLVEYDEIWRTNLVRQVKCGDIVFLFRRGGYGYVGVFKVEGWRVISKEDNIIKEIVCKKGTEKEEDDENQIKADIENYDIYKSIDDGATSCANLIVEPLAFDYEGVSYPGGVYRRTISRYDNGYARILLARFKAKENDPTFNTLDKNGEKIAANTTVFDELTQNITQAERGENGCWK